MNLANLGKAGLLTAQNRLQTTGHNINNADTTGYSRQSVIVQTAGATATASGWIGRGVMAVTVQRAYDDFVNRQLMESKTRNAALVTYQNQIGQVNNLLADRTVGISPALQKFFDGVQAVATSPADVAARQELVGRANSLATQIRDADAYLDSQRDNINTQIATTVEQINSYLDRIRDANQRITAAKALSTAQPPNDLLDQRDQLVSELGELVNVSVFVQDDRVNLTIGNGQIVLGGDSVFHLQAAASLSDPGRMAVFTTVPDGSGGVASRELDDRLISGGHLGGLLSFRADVLDVTQNDLGRLAIGLAATVNAQHRQGYDLSGNPGGDFFTQGQATVIPAQGNSATAVPAVTFTDTAKLTNADYQLTFDGTQYVVARLPSGTALATGTGVLAFDGLEVDTSGLTPQAGDRWVIQPTRNAATALSVVLTDPAAIAAAGPAPDGSAAGSANGDNALKLAALQTAKVLGGSATSPQGVGNMGLVEAYAQLVNTVAVKAQQNTTAVQAQATLVQQNTAAQQAVSGVNLDEEYINLQRYQEQYRAAARMIDTASTLFDTLLNLRG